MNILFSISWRKPVSVSLGLMTLGLAVTSNQAATFTVANTNRTGSGSLQQALFDANTNAGPDTISFNIASGGLTISPTNALPIIVEPVTIDGRTQPGFSGAPLIEINGAGAGAAVDGLKINTSNCLISALVINGFLGDGIEITNGVNNVVEGCYIGLNRTGATDAGNTLNGVLITNSPANTIGGLGATNRNFISGNNQAGIVLGGVLSASNSVLGNVIGLNVTNNAVPNGVDGIRLNAPFTTIGGNTAAARNIISGNTGDGIESVAPSGTNLVVRGNWIGVDTNGVLDRGNTQNGIIALAGASIIGGSGAGEGNLITGNNEEGIELNGVSSTNHIVRGNIIGSSSAFGAVVINNGNGILITSSSRSNVIGGILAGEANTIYFNGGDGIGVAAATANTNNAFRGNLIFGSGASGIDLGTSGITANDNGDADVGANQLQNFPVLTSVSNTATTVFITGTLNSRPSTTYAIDFFSSVEADTVLNGEGQFYIGSTNLATGADSNLAFTVSYPVTLQGRHVTATATDPSGNTSEFSAATASVSFVSAQTFTVVNTNDSGAGSLREAINLANLAATTGSDTIQFTITNLSTTISPTSELPAITDPVTMDGYTQPGAAVNTSATTFNGTVLVRIAGASAGSGANGITITTSNCVVRGLIITGFVSTGADGIEILGGGNNLIEGCLLGIDSSGADQGNGANGVFISSSSNNVIGGTTAAARNVISGNQSDGVEINGAGATGNQVLGNLIGTGLTGIGSVPNSADGVFVTGAGANVIGGSVAGAGNLISGNSSDGIELTGASTTNTTVLGNRIGTEVMGAVALANTVHGININTSSRSNIIGGVIVGEANTIAFNGQDGVNIAAATPNTNNIIRGNSIFSNGTTTGELGIDLGATGVQANDLGDADTGANQLQNYPLLAWVTNSVTETVISGSLNSRPLTTYTIDFYANTETDTDGFGEGKFYLGSTNLSTLADSNVTFTISLPVASLPGRYVTATATDPFGNTSEFGAHVSAVSTVPGTTYTVVNTNDAGAGSLRQAILNANANISAGDTVAFAITNLSTTISPSSALPSITDPVTIDGYTQPGAAVNTSATIFNGTVLVRIAGASAGSGANGLTITIGNCTVRGLMITGFTGAGDGIEISGGGNNLIEGCLLGIDATGTDQGNAANGVLISGSANNIIGGTTPAARNVISGNNSDGIEINGAGAMGNQVLGNLLGAGLTGATPVVNTGDGVLVTGAGANIIGGSVAGAGNLISGNNNDGIELTGLATTNTIVLGNRIGTDASGSVSVLNGVHGININGNSRSNAIGGVLAGEGNTIAFNGQDGVNIAAATANTNNTIRGNSIFSNGTTTGELGIDLGAAGVTANDLGDPDTGANQLQNFPVLAWVTNTVTDTIFSGSLNSRSSTTYTVDFYANTAPDTDGVGEGQYYLGSTNLTTGADSNVTFTISLPVAPLPARYISATATDPFGNTSEFGTNVFAQSTAPGTTFTVVNTNDSGAGSLRQAILNANANVSEGDTIAFAITNLSFTIAPSSALPVVNDPVVIDGSTQLGFSSAPLVEISGINAGVSVDGLSLATSNSVIRSLAINRFRGDGIEINGGRANTVEGCYLGLGVEGLLRRGNGVYGINIVNSPLNVIGGLAVSNRNYVCGNTNAGVFITGTTAVSNRFFGNVIGLNITSGIVLNGGGGISSSSPFTIVGGSVTGARNIISGNTAWGISLLHPATNSVIQGNYIGTDPTGTLDLGSSGYGVSSTAGGTLVGGAGVNEGNLISGNIQAAVELNGTSSTNNIVKGNILGADITGTLAIPNNIGVSITGNSRSNIIGGVLAGEANLIAFNNTDGINVAAAVSNTNNTLRGNVIFSNSDSVLELGIDLGANGITANDAGDADTGANGLQNFPVVTNVLHSLTGTEVSGFLSSQPLTTYILDFYANQAQSPSGSGEAQSYLGALTVTTDVSGSTNFMALFGSNLPGRYLTATATDPFGNTSEFAVNFATISTAPGVTIVVTNTNNSGSGSLREAIIQANAVITSGDTITFAIPGAGVHTIAPTNALPAITDKVTIDGYSQLGAVVNTLCDSNSAVIQIRLSGTNAGFDTDGLVLNSSGSIVRGLCIVGFDGDGIQIEAVTNTSVEGCFIGLESDGVTGLGNHAYGVRVTSGQGNRIGGTNAPARNIISGNGFSGVMLNLSASNIISGNLIGTDRSGTLARGNADSGVALLGATSAGNIIGGLTDCERNVISGNGTQTFFDHFGIGITSGRFNTIVGNIIGLAVNGTQVLGNASSGVRLGGASFNTVGNGTVAGRNIISGNGYAGVAVDLTSPTNIITGNYIGTDVTGLLDRGNEIYGVILAGASYNEVSGNVVSGNDNDAVYVAGNSSPGNRVRGNLIGVDSTGVSPVPNNGTGVRIEQSTTQVGGTNGGDGNIIAFNTSRGVSILSGDVSCPVLGNAIYANGSLGIDLNGNGVTPNDAGDSDTGGNNLQNYPVLMEAIRYPSQTIITATLNSQASTSYRIEFFNSATNDPTGFGEGQTYLGFTNVTTGGSGNVAFSFTHPAALTQNSYITATATDATNNTSEFSAVRKVVPFDSVDLNIVIADSDDPASRSTNHLYTLYITNSGPAEATSIFVTNTLPVELLYVNATPSQGTASHSSGIVTLNLGTITNGGFATVLLEVAATNTGSFLNQALVVAASQLDNETNNNSDAESTFFGIADLAVSITDSPDPVVAGQVLTNIVVVTNRGPDTATFVNASFDLDLTAAPTAASVSQGSFIQSGNNFSFSPGTIPAGGSVTLTVTGIPTESGLISHFASASAAEADFVFTNNNTSANTTVTDGAGVLQFLLTTFNVTEGSAQAFVFVKRTGGAIGNVAAGYSTSNGSATAGLDYSNTVGTISFTNGETIKTFSVPVINDVLFECNEFFWVSLHSPTGGLVLIVNTQAVVNIIENDLNPAGNVKVASGSTNLLPGAAGNDNSFQSSVSADGRYVTFSSDASNLSPDDDNFNQDVFIRDLLTQTTTLVSYEQGGTTSGNGGSQNAIISGDGRYVVFDSYANDLNFPDNNFNQDVFVRDLLTGANTLVSINSAGTNSGNDGSYSSNPTRSLISSNGQWIVYTSYASDLVDIPDSNFDVDVFLFDRLAGTNRLISVNLAGTDAGNGSSTDPVVSADGQVVAFESTADDLVALPDGNFGGDVFVQDQASGVNELISVNLSGTAAGSGLSAAPYLSQEGRYVVFHSSASNLATNDTNTRTDVFWRDRTAGVTLLVSVNTNNVAGNSFSTVRGISANGRYVVFSSTSYDLVPGDYNFSEDVFVRDMFSNVTVLVSKTFFGSDPGNGASRNPVISGDGTHVAFESYATDLTPATKFSFYTDIFVRNLTNNTMRLVSFRNGGTNGPNGNSYDAAISFTGNVTAFTGEAEGGGGGGEGLMALNGSINFSDVWAHTFASNTTELVSVSAPSQTGSGYSFDPQVSRDGQWVAFTSTADNLVTNDVNGTDDVFVINVNSSAIELVSANNTNGSGIDFSSNPSISTNGNYVAFESYANDLVSGDNNFTTDVFVRDRLAGTNILVSVNLAGTGPGNSYSQNPAISHDGRYVAFESFATDLTALSDTNFNTDIFLRDRVAGTTTLISRNVTGTSSASSSSYNPVIEVDAVSGKVYVAYISSAGNLVSNDTNSNQDVFLYDVTAGSNYLVSINVAGNGSGNDSSYNPQLAVGPASSNVFVAFSSTSTDLVNNDTNFSEDIFIYRLSTGMNELVSVNQTGTGSGDNYSTGPTLSANARYVAFSSGAGNLTVGDTNSQQDVFLRDRQTGVTTLISKNCDSSGSGDGFSFNPVISADGRYVSYLSSADDLMPGNFTSFAQNVFRYDRQLGVTTLISQNRNLTGGANASSYDNQISANGNTVAFSSEATDLVADDNNNQQDVFAWLAGAVAPLPDLVLDKTASVPSIVECYAFSYSLNVTNNGSSVATGVTLADNLPAGVSFVSATSTQGSVTNSGNNVTASVGSLGIGIGARVTINVTAITAGNHNNFASAAANEADAAPGNNSDSVLVTVTPLPSPVLSPVLTNGNQLLVSWPSSTPNVFTVQTTTNLTPVIVWTPITNSISDNGTLKSVLLNVNMGEPERFYRLKK